MLFERVEGRSVHSIGTAGDYCAKGQRIKGARPGSGSPGPQNESGPLLRLPQQLHPDPEPVMHGLAFVLDVVGGLWVRASGR